MSPTKTLPSAPSSRTVLSPRRVLLVDDSPIVCEAAEIALTEAGYEVSTKDSAIGLSGVVYRLRPAVVVLDVEMPALSGPEACARVRQAYPKAKIVLFSSVANLADLAIACGVDGWAPKKAGVSALLEAVGRFGR